MPSDRLQFFVVTRKPSLELDLQRVLVANDLQASLSDMLSEQSQEFTSDESKKRAFCGTYRPNKNEVVSITPFPLPPLLQRAVRTPQEFAEAQVPFPDKGPLVKALLGVNDGGSSGTPQFLFQHFDQTHILKPKRTFLFQSGMFHQLAAPGVTISDRLTAVITGSELLFRSFQRANQFLDLTSYFREATDAEIKTLIGHTTFCRTDADAVLEMCRPAMRRKFSSILHSKILEHPLATPDRIRNRAKLFGIALQVRVVEGTKRLVFPTDASDANKLLQYLAEELYFSDLTEQPRETNSHRPHALTGVPLPVTAEA